MHVRATACTQLCQPWIVVLPGDRQPTAQALTGRNAHLEHACRIISMHGFQSNQIRVKRLAAVQVCDLKGQGGKVKNRRISAYV